jgi:glycosyltransferase involved in cell wall biosynthesis
MKVTFVRTKIESTVFSENGRTHDELDEAMLQRLKISPKAGSSSKNLIRGLQQKGIVTGSEEWKFWSGAFKEIAMPGQFSVKLFPCNGRLTSEQMAPYLAANGQPDILWVEGTDYPPYIEQIFALCPDSFKLVYSKEWRPWKIEKLAQYDLCLVDEAWEAEEVKKIYPAVHCAVWDKLIDYETMHYPIPCKKIYDICYVAYLRPRKNHKLLFNAMAKLNDRKLTCVCVGDERKGNREELEKLVADLNLSVHFTGEVPKEEVNRYINQSKIGVMCSELDAAPRAILEYMAADIPVLVNSELWAGTRYVGLGAGLIKSPEEFQLGLAELVDNFHKYSPRAYYLEHYSFEKVMDRFIGILKQAGFKGVME